MRNRQGLSSFYGVDGGVDAEFLLTEHGRWLEKSIRKVESQLGVIRPMTRRPKGAKLPDYRYRYLLKGVQPLTKEERERHNSMSLWGNSPSAAQPHAVLAASVRTMAANAPIAEEPDHEGSLIKPEDGVSPMNRDMLSHVQQGVVVDDHVRMATLYREKAKTAAQRWRMRRSSLDNVISSPSLRKASVWQQRQGSDMNGIGLNTDMISSSFEELRPPSASRQSGDGVSSEKGGIDAKSLRRGLLASSAGFTSAEVDILMAQLGDGEIKYEAFAALCESTVGGLAQAQAQSSGHRVSRGSQQSRRGRSASDGEMSSIPSAILSEEEDEEDEEHAPEPFGRSSFSIAGGSWADGPPAGFADETARGGVRRPLSKGNIPTMLDGDEDEYLLVAPTSIPPPTGYGDSGDQNPTVRF